MPGYITNAMMLIRMEEWLLQVIQALLEKWPGSPAVGCSDLAELETKLESSPLTKLERRILLRALRVRCYLRPVPATTSGEVPWLTNIKDQRPGEEGPGEGHGLSRFAFVGSLGPDFPLAAHILALHQRWVYYTMHRGSPRRAWVDAGSTRFILNFIDAINEKFPQPERKRDLMAYVIGHLSTIASYVVLRPFIDHWVWHEQKKIDAKGTARHRLEVALDAKVAVGFFQREDLHSGKNEWPDYYLDSGAFEEDLERLMELYQDVFQRTYRSVEPLETLCDFPGVEQLKADYPGLAGLLASTEGLEQALSRFTKYKELVRRFPGIEGKLKGLGEEKGQALIDLLKDAECKFAKLDKAFLMDGYRNTVNWALDVGYDQSRPQLLIWVFWTLGILGGGALLTYLIWSDTSDYSIALADLFDIRQEEVDAIATDARNEWRNDGLGGERIWFRIVATSYTLSGILEKALAYTAGGEIPVLNWFTDVPMLFGQGRVGEFSDLPVGWQIVGVLQIVYLLFDFPIVSPFRLAVPRAYESTAGRWLNFSVASFLNDLVDYLFKNRRNEAEGREGDILRISLYWPRIILWVGFSVAALFAFGIKARRNGGEPETEDNGLDYVLGLVGLLPLLALVWIPTDLFGRKLVEDVVGAAWPDTDTGAIDPYLVFAVKGGRKDLRSHARSPVAVFKDDTLPKENGKAHFPQAPADTPYDERAEKDAAERKGGSIPSAGEELFVPLIERATYLGGLLAMAAVNYDAVGTEEKSRTRSIFKDWNLDYRTEREWQDLMETVGTKPGLLLATETWWKHLNGESPAAPGPAALARLEDVMGLARPTHAGRIEDRSAAPHLKAEDTGHRFLPAGTAFTIADRDGNVVFTGTTEADGRFGATLPPGDDFELRIEQYDGLKT